MDGEKLDRAALQNLVAERSVGFISSELTSRVAEQRGSASSAQMKSKANDLIIKTATGSFIVENLAREAT